MRILLDECLPVDFRHSFPGREAHSVEWAGLKGKKNGELLQAADEGFPGRRHYQGIGIYSAGPECRDSVFGLSLAPGRIHARNR